MSRCAGRRRLKPSPSRRHEDGIALIMVLLVTSCLSALGLGLAVIVSASQRAEGNFADSVGMLYAADAGIELAAHDLAQAGDWDLALSGAGAGELADGSKTGNRNIPAGGRLSLDMETNAINCGKPSPCTAAQMDAITRDRPWGANNPRWQLFEYGPLTRIALARPSPWYLLVWVGDDSREADGNPLADGASAERRGRGVVRVRAEVFGFAGARRVVEAELARACRREGAAEVCQPGVRVQSWQELRQLVP